MCAAAWRGRWRGVGRELKPRLARFFADILINNSTVARPVPSEKQVEQPASAAYRALRGCGYACPRGRATRLVWESPEVIRPWAGRTVRLPGSPHICTRNSEAKISRFTQLPATTLDIV
jgi:hypothetical protein